MTDFDYIVIGAGIAGASVGAELALDSRVMILEAESAPGYHATGRSAAMFAANYGSPTYRLLTAASKSFFESPPDGFSESPLFGHAYGSLFLARQDQLEQLERLFETTTRTGGKFVRLTSEEIVEKCPVIRGDVVVAGLYEPTDREIEVANLHQGYLKLFKRRGGAIQLNSRVQNLRFEGSSWRVVTSAGDFGAARVINAAGAWGDRLAEMAGLASIGLSPRRRTAITFQRPKDLQISNWPLCIGIEEDFYFKPDAGMILASPANEDPMPASDVQPDELDIAFCVDRIETHTTLEIKRIGSKWAGLRTFTPDRDPGVGADPSNPNFIWCVGQGGYGIQSAPAMARLTASIARGDGIPEDLANRGLEYADVSIERFTS